MQLVTNITLIINILIILLFIIAEMFVFKPTTAPKMKALCGANMAGMLGIYLILMFFISALGLLNHKYSYLIFILFVILPFIIGHYTKYETLHKYAIFQILAFCISFVLLFLFN